MSGDNMTRLDGRRYRGITLPDEQKKSSPPNSYFEERAAKFRCPEKLSVLWGEDQSTGGSLLCFAVISVPESISEPEKLLIYAVCPEDCCVYKVCEFTSTSSFEYMVCISSGSKIFVFGGRKAGTKVWYVDLGKGSWELIEHKEGLNCTKARPVAFSHLGKIYALDSMYSLSDEDKYSFTPEDDEEELDYYQVGICRFEVLDTCDGDGSWRPLANPPLPYGSGLIYGSTFVAGPKPRFLIENSHYVYIYDLDKDIWLKVRVYFAHPMTGCDYALHLHSNCDFAPLFPSHIRDDLAPLSVPPLGLLYSRLGFSLSPIDLKRSILHSEFQLAPTKLKYSEGLPQWKEDSHLLNDPDLSLISVQVFHLVGPRFCFLQFYKFVKTSDKFVRVATFDVDFDQDAGGTGAEYDGATDAFDYLFAHSKPSTISSKRLVAQYIDSKIYSLGKLGLITPLSCGQISPVMV